jgi:hypothetical protein
VLAVISIEAGFRIRLPHALIRWKDVPALKDPAAPA